MKICLTAGLADQLGGRIAELVGDAGIVRLEDDGTFRGDPAECEVLCFSTRITDHPAASRSLARFVGAPALRWVQSPGAGVDNPFFTLLLQNGIRLTNGSGIHAEPIAQYVLAYVLHWEREVAAHLRQQARGEWAAVRSGDLTTKTLGIVGYGGIGQATARIAKAIGMRVLATRRRAIEDPMVDELLPPSGLPKLLAASDYVLLCLPFSEETRHTIGAAELDAMKHTAILVNVARGGVVDEPALIDALRQRTIRGATLDVVSEEPLPPDSPLWGLENCIVTPHDSGSSPQGDVRLGELFLENLGHWIRGEPLRNEVFSTGFGRSEPRRPR